MLFDKPRLTTQKSRTKMLLFVILTLLLSSTIAAATQDYDSTTDSGSIDDDLSTDHIDYREQDIKVIREPDNKSQVSIKVGSDEFSVRWGEASSTGAVELVTTRTSYLGVADIYSVNGDYKNRIGIPIQKVFRAEFPGILEYADQDSDGMFTVSSDGKAGTLTEIINEAEMTHEPVYKYVNLGDADWSLRDWDNSSDTDSRNRALSFTLVAENITYEGVKEGTMSDNTSKLDAVEITFYGSTKEEVVDIEGVPHYKVKVVRDADDSISVKDTQKISSSNVTGHVLNTTWKYDVKIKGWDGVEINNTLDRNDSRLFSVIEVASATRIDQRIGDWIRDNFDSAINPEVVIGNAKRKITDSTIGSTYDTNGWMNVCKVGKVTEIDSSGERMEMNASEISLRSEEKTDDESNARSDDTTDNATDDDRANKSRKERLLDAVESRYDRVKSDCVDHGALKNNAIKRATAIRGGSLYFEDSGAELGRLRWVNNVSIREDGEEMDFEVVYQVHGRRSVVQTDLPNNDTNDYRGVLLIGGFNYPVAEEIFHDPEVSSDAVFMDIFDRGFASADLAEGERGELPGFTVFVSAMAMFAAAFVGRRKMSS